MRSEALNASTVSMSSDVIAVIDHADPKLVRVFDTLSGKELGKPIQHVLDITSVQLNRWGPANQRKCILQVWRRLQPCLPLGLGRCCGARARADESRAALAGP